MTAEHPAPSEISEKPLAYGKHLSANPMAAEICLLCAGSGLFNRIKCTDCQGTGVISVVDDQRRSH